MNRGMERKRERWRKRWGYGGFFMCPSARSEYLCIAPDWKTERRRSWVCKEGAVQGYPDLARGELKNSIIISFFVEVDSMKYQRRPNLHAPTMIDPKHDD